MVFLKASHNCITWMYVDRDVDTAVLLESKLQYLSSVQFLLLLFSTFTVLMQLLPRQVTTAALQQQLTVNNTHLIKVLVTYLYTVCFDYNKEVYTMSPLSFGSYYKRSLPASWGANPLFIVLCSFACFCLYHKTFN